MMKQVRTIGEVMNRFPRTIPRGTTLQRAQVMMRRLGVRHLPVVDEVGKVVGLVSERDLECISLFPDRVGVDVDTLMNPDLYTVSREEPLRAVVSRMTKSKYGSAIVIDKAGKPEGIFTSVDALRVLGTFLEQAA